MTKKEKKAFRYLIIGFLLFVLDVFLVINYLNSWMKPDIRVDILMMGVVLEGVISGFFLTVGIDILASPDTSKTSGVISLVPTESGYAMRLDLSDPLDEVARQNEITLSVGFNEDIFKGADEDGDET